MKTPAPARCSRFVPKSGFNSSSSPAIPALPALSIPTSSKPLRSFSASIATRKSKVVAIGRKGRDAYRKRGATITAEHINLLQKAQYSDAAEIAKAIIDRFIKGEIDSIYMLNNEFKSVVSQKVAVAKLLPVTLPEQKEMPDFIFEQPPLEILERLLPR